MHVYRRSPILPVLALEVTLGVRGDEDVAVIERGADGEGHHSISGMGVKFKLKRF